LALGAGFGAVLGGAAFERDEVFLAFREAEVVLRAGFAFVLARVALALAFLAGRLARVFLPAAFLALAFVFREAVCFRAAVAALAPRVVRFFPALAVFFARDDRLPAFEVDVRFRLERFVLDVVRVVGTGEDSPRVPG
jgi:hypothetical protein